MAREGLEGLDLSVVREGAVEVEVPASSAVRRRGPARADAPVFYNAAMELSRDLSVAVLNAVGTGRWRVLDGLAGSGIRGVRYAVEGPEGVDVTLNDRSPLAAALCQRNLERNGIATGRATHERLEVLLARERFDMVDVDPFGSPSPFIPLAVRAVRRGGLLVVTATDTPALCGSRPAPCLRRYGARPWRGDAMHEVALRILAGACVREAARTDRAAVPVLCIAEDHYVRVFCRVDKGAARADEALASMGYSWQAEDGGVGHGSAPPAGDVQWAGPLWLGDLHDVRVVRALEFREVMRAAPRLERLRQLWLEEAGLPPLLVEVNRASSRIGHSTPKMADLIEKLREMGFAAGRAHTNPLGVKTDAPMDALEEAIRRASP